MRFAAGLFAGLGALASFDALAASSYGSFFAVFFLVIAGGVLACPIVELALGRGGWGRRLAIGVGLAYVDTMVLLVSMSMWIEAGIRSGPSLPSSGPGSPILIALVPWIIPAARAFMLRR